MRRVSALLIRRALADDGLAANHGRLGRLRFRLFDRGVDGIGVMAVDVRNHVPAISFEAFRRVVGEPTFNFAVDGNAVVVVETNQLAHAQCARQRARLVRDTFHQTTVAEENVSVMIDDVMAGAIEFLREQFFRDRHADRIGDTLAKRAGGGFHAGRHAVFGVAGGFRMQLAEILDFFNRQIVAGQMQQRV